MENGAILLGSLNRCPLFWPKVHRLGRLSLEGGRLTVCRLASRACEHWCGVLRASGCS